MLVDAPGIKVGVEGGSEIPTKEKKRKNYCIRAKGYFIPETICAPG